MVNSSIIIFFEFAWTKTPPNIKSQRFHNIPKEPPRKERPYYFKLQQHSFNRLLPNTRELNFIRFRISYSHRRSVRLFITDQAVTVIVGNFSIAVSELFRQVLARCHSAHIRNGTGAGTGNHTATGCYIASI